MVTRGIQKVRIVLQELIGKNDFSQVDDAITVMKAMLSEAVRADPYTLIVVDLTNIQGVDQDTARPLCVAFAGITNVDWDKYYSLAGLTSNSRFVLNAVMTSADLIAVDFTQNESVLMGRTAAAQTAAPIWQWLKNEGGWHSAYEILTAFKDTAIRARYPGSHEYTTPQIRTAMTNLYGYGLIFTDRTTPPTLTYRAVGNDEDREP